MKITQLAYELAENATAIASLDDANNVYRLADDATIKIYEIYEEMDQNDRTKAREAYNLYKTFSEARSAAAVTVAEFTRGNNCNHAFEPALCAYKKTLEFAQH